MGYKNLSSCVRDLEANNLLKRVDFEVNPVLEIAAIQRRVYARGGPALLFPRVQGTRFPMVSNLFGTLERTRWIFRDTISRVEALIAAKIDPLAALRSPRSWPGLIAGGLSSLPAHTSSGPILRGSATLSDLPRLVSWPKDGGAYITLPCVYSENIDRPGWRHSNLGMYRVQLDGNRYAPDEVGLHYQIHRGIGVHHERALAANQDLEVAIIVGGPPALAVAAVMPLPENLPELAFAGALSGHRVQLIRDTAGFPIPAEADFVIRGKIGRNQKPEGPFGDHLGYYSLEHDFPVMRVTAVHARPDAIWPFTVVGRPPQEDTSFGEFIHDITGPVIPTLVAGVDAVHAVDAAGVHPLMLARGSERYTAYNELCEPMELLTQASAILGQGQMSLSKYLLIYAKNDNDNLKPNDIQGCLRHILERVDWRRDLHFITRTTIDTLDYTGPAINKGSKLIIAAAGPRCRELPKEIISEFHLPEGFGRPHVVMPGILAIKAPKHQPDDDTLERFCRSFDQHAPINTYPLVVLVDDAEFTARHLDNFLWVTFTRSNPSHDVDGIASSVKHKHWGCEGSLVIDARHKSHHAPLLEEDPAVTKRIEELAANNGPLAGLI